MSETTGTEMFPVASQFCGSLLCQGCWARLGNGEARTVLRDDGIDLELGQTLVRHFTRDQLPQANAERPNVSSSGNAFLLVNDLWAKSAGMRK